MARRPEPPRGGSRRVTPRGLWPVLRWVIRHGNPSWAALVGAFLSLSLAGVCAAGSIPWMRRAVDAAVGREAQPLAVVKAAVVWWLCNAAAALFAFAGRQGAARLGADMAARFREQVHAHLLRRTWGLEAGRPAGELMQRSVLDASAMQGLLLEPLTLAGSALATFLATGYFLARMSLAVALLAIPVAVGALLVNWRIWAGTRGVWRQYREANGRMWTVLAENVRGWREIRAFGRQHDRGELYRAASQQVAANEARSALVSGGITASFALLLPMAGALMLGVAGVLVLRGKLTAGELAAFCSYGWMLTGPLSAVARQYETFHNGMSAAERVLALLDAEAPDLLPPRGSLPTGPQGARVEAIGLEVATAEGLCLLKEVTLSLAPGELVAVVGHSGAGKTTLAHALLGLCPCTQGEISLDGLPLSQWPEEALRAQTAISFQDPVLFRGSIGDNVRFGAPLGGSTEVAEHLAHADAAEFVGLLPEGADAPIGEEGQGLSIGERRRVALARALARRPRFLVLDEPTASIDRDSERRIRHTLLALRGTLTCLVTSHQAQLVEVADRVVVLDRGRVVAEGTHRDLLRDCAGYAELLGLEGDDRAARVRASVKAP